MGYSTDFNGALSIEPALNSDQVDYLRALAGTRRMKRDPEKAAKFDDPKREAVGLPIGEEGEFYIGSESDDDCGQAHDPSVIEYNGPPCTQPGLWLQWVPTEDGTLLEWDGMEKFYRYETWLQYLIEKIFIPWGHKLNGSIQWSGEDMGDIGVIHVKDNEIKLVDIEYPGANSSLTSGHCPDEGCPGVLEPTCSHCGKEWKGEI